MGAIVRRMESFFIFYMASGYMAFLSFLYHKSKYKQDVKLCPASTNTASEIIYILDHNYVWAITIEK